MSIQWPVKDVNMFPVLTRFHSSPLDSLRQHCGLCYAGCYTRMDSMASGFPVLSGTRLSESRDMEYKDPGSCHHGRLHRPEVRSTLAQSVRPNGSCRLIFLPVMVVTLPLPQQVTKSFPVALVYFLQWFAFYSFAGLLTIPWLCCVYQLVTRSFGRTRRIKHVLDEATAPKVVIVMPCYKEEPSILLRTVDSIADCDYPSSCLHIFLSFDGDAQDELYMKTIEELGVPMTMKIYPKSIDLAYKGLRITVSRFPHGGKRQCQKRTFKLIDKIYAQYIAVYDDLFVLFIDSDCILDKVCIQNFMYDMELKPGSKHNMLAMTGVITSTTEKNSLLTVLQDMEYIHGQLFERSVESGCGAVTCLPGALTILRFSAFRKMAKYYFADKTEQCDDLFDYGKCHLGEDRWLTHLFMIGAKERYQIQMNTGAFCKTEAVQTFKSLLKQRRRWFLGFITNEACMLTDVRLWRRYPLLLLVRFAQNTLRTTALLFFILVISLITTSQRIAQLPVGFIAVSLGLNWLLMLYFGAKLGRYKIMLYPLMFIVNPFLNWTYMVYGIFTAGQRTWGGPRADAGVADSHTTPQAAIEHAEATGDDLNILPETFKPAIEAITRRKSVKTMLMPSSGLEGQFSPDEAMFPLNIPHDEESQPETTIEHKVETPRSNRESAESWFTGSSMDQSVYRPRRLGSFMATDDTAVIRNAEEKFHDAARAKQPESASQQQSRVPASDNIGNQPSSYNAMRQYTMARDSSDSDGMLSPLDASFLWQTQPSSREHGTNTSADSRAEQYVEGSTSAAPASGSRQTRAPNASRPRAQNVSDAREDILPANDGSRDPSVTRGGVLSDQHGEVAGTEATKNKKLSKKRG